MMTCCFYGHFAICGNTSTPKYVLSKWIGKYPPLRFLVGKDSKISFYLQKPVSDNSDAPQYRLQGKSSVNITGLWPCGNNVFFGQPPRGQRFSAKQRENPFAGHEMDGFVFVFDTEKIHFDMFVFSGQRLNVGQIANDIARGGYSKLIANMKEHLTHVQDV